MLGAVESRKLRRLYQYLMLPETAASVPRLATTPATRARKAACVTLHDSGTDGSVILSPKRGSFKTASTALALRGIDEGRHARRDGARRGVCRRACVEPRRAERRTDRATVGRSAPRFRSQRWRHSRSTPSANASGSARRPSCRSHSCRWCSPRSSSARLRRWRSGRSRLSVSSGAVHAMDDLDLVRASVGAVAGLAALAVHSLAARDSAGFS